MPDPVEPRDLIKQVDDHAECEWLLDHLTAHEAKLLWDHYALGIPVGVLARREGMTAGWVLWRLESALKRLQYVKGRCDLLMACRERMESHDVALMTQSVIR